MSIATFEGVVEQGQIHLKSSVHLPEKIRVYVVVPDFQIEQVVHVFTPRLAHPEQAAEFKLEVVEDTTNAKENETDQRQETVHRIDALRERLFATYGEMPDSAALIRADREREHEESRRRQQ